MSISDDVIRVLHVDDEPDFADITAQFLERENDRFDVVTETTASAGLDRVQGGDFDCIVSDYDMPGRDGLEFLKEVRAEDPDLPFILFTGKGSEEIASEAISAGVTDYIQKQSMPEQYTILANRITNSVDRFRAERETERSHRVMETASEGLSLVQPDGTFSYVNPAFARLFGYDRDELLGEHWTVLYHDEEAERLDNEILPAVSQTGYWSGETVRLTKQGERLVTDHRLAHTEDGVIVCTARDITPERTEAADQTNGFDLLFDAMGDFAFYTLDHEGFVTRWNEQAERLMGYAPAEILGRHVSTFFSEEDRKNGLPERLIERAKTEGTITDEGWRIRKDGSRFWANATMAASYDETGTLRGFGKMVREAPKEQAPA